MQRMRRLAGVAAAGPVVACRPLRREPGVVEVVAVRSGALVASARVAVGEVADVAAELHDRVRFGATVPAASDAERDLVARWLEGGGVTILACDGRLAQPVAGGAALHAAIDALASSRRRAGRPADELSRKRTRRPGPSPA